VKRTWRSRGLVFASIFCQFGFAHSCFALDFSQVYAQGMENDPTFQSAQHTFEAARERQPEAFAALLPSIAADASGEHITGRTKYTGTPEVDRSFQGNDWQVQLKQPVFQMEGIWAYGEAKATVQAAVALLTQAKQDLILRLARAYFDIAIAQRHVTAAQSQLTAMREQLGAARRSFDAGVTSITDVDDSTSRAALAEAQTAVSANELATARASLESLIGAPVQDIKTLDNGIALPNPVPADVEAWVRTALSESPSVQGARSSFKAAELEVNRVGAQLLPAVNLVASVGSNYSSGNITDPVNFGANVHDRQISLQVAVPLFDGGAIHAQVVEARAKRAKAQSDVTLAERQVTLEVRQTFADVMNGIAQQRALKMAVRAGRSAVKGNRIGYGLGLRINSDVLNAEQQLFGTIHDLDKTSYDVLYSSLKLKGAAGQLSEADVYALSRLMQNEAVSDEQMD